MNVPFELHIALRYLFAKRKQALISLISFISIIGVGVGVMAIIIALAVMTGLQQEVRDRLVGASAHVYVAKRTGIADYEVEAARLKGIPHVIGAAPAIFGQGIIAVAGGAQLPMQLKGIDPALEPQVTQIATAMTSGSLTTLDPHDELSGILLGSDLAKQLGVSVGDRVSIATMAGIGSPIGRIPGASRQLRVAGVFTLGFFEVDATFGMVSLATAKRLLAVDEVERIQLRVDDLGLAPAVADAITATLGDDYVAEDWGDMNKSLYSALRLEKLAISLAIGLIVMVAALNIVATLILLVMEKHRDIAILKTMGTSARSVTMIFMLQGLVIGLIGTGTGATLGYVACGLLDHYKIIQVPVDVYQISYLPFTVLPGDFALVVVSALIICLVATIYPSRQAARLDPTEALRYE